MPDLHPAPTLPQLCAAFAKVSLTSFGGGLSGWMMRDFVGRRRWVALAQAFPGVNVVNLSIWLGYRLRGGPGALAAALAMVVPAVIVAVSIVALFQSVAEQPLVRRVLPGVGAAAIGLSLQTGLRAGRRALRAPVPAVIMAGVFMCVGVLRWPLLPVVAVAAPVSIAFAWPKR